MHYSGPQWLNQFVSSSVIHPRTGNNTGSNDGLRSRVIPSVCVCLLDFNVLYTLYTCMCLWVCKHVCILVCMYVCVCVCVCVCVLFEREIENVCVFEVIHVICM